MEIFLLVSLAGMGTVTDRNGDAIESAVPNDREECNSEVFSSEVERLLHGRFANIVFFFRAASHEYKAKRGMLLQTYMLQGSFIFMVTHDKTRRQLRGTVRMKVACCSAVTWLWGGGGHVWQ